MTLQVSNSDPIAKSNPQQQRDNYLEALLSTVQQQGTPALPLSELRTRAVAIAREHGFPSPRQEDWRFTDLTPMLSVPFAAADAIAPPDLSLPELPEAAARLVFVNGHYSEALSHVGTLPTGVVVGNLGALYTGELKVKIDQRLGLSGNRHEMFAALNTAGFQDAALVWVPRHQTVDAPIHLVFVAIAGDRPVLSQPRCLVVAEPGSALTLVEEFYGIGESAHFSNSVSEIWVDEGAQVTHTRVQQEGSGTFHIGKTAITQGRDSTYHGTAISLGAHIARHHWEMDQTGPQTETQLNGLSAIAGRQTADTHSLIALHHPHGTANQLHKCLVDDSAHSIFNGKIWVPRAAQLTNASQLNRNLLLSNKGRIDTKPELDIVADNVKCAHGATVSQLDASEIFYLQSRGISADQAQRLLIYGFVMEILAKIPSTSLRNRLIQAVID